MVYNIWDFPTPLKLHWTLAKFRDLLIGLSRHLKNGGMEY